MKETYSSLGHLFLHKSIHIHNAAFFRYSNSSGQKVDNKSDKPIQDDKKSDNVLESLEQGEKLGLFARFKKMGKDYWYVLIPVHVVTSLGWLGAGYYTSVR